MSSDIHRKYFDKYHMLESSKINNQVVLSCMLLARLKWCWCVITKDQFLSMRWWQSFVFANFTVNYKVGWTYIPIGWQIKSSTGTGKYWIVFFKQKTICSARAKNVSSVLCNHLDRTVHFLKKMPRLTLWKLKYLLTNQRAGSIEVN